MGLNKITEGIYAGWTELQRDEFIRLHNQVDSLTNDREEVLKLNRVATVMAAKYLNERDELNGELQPLKIYRLTLEADNETLKGTVSELLICLENIRPYLSQALIVMKTNGQPIDPNLETIIEDIKYVIAKNKTINNDGL